jgi:hypothetical protein
MNGPRKPRWRQRDPQKFNLQWRTWYRANAEKKIAWQNRRKAELRTWFVSIKATLKCERCGESTIECLQFHHRDPNQKDIELSRVVANGWSKARILREMAKCDVLCANCHLKRHWELRRSRKIA